ncbi:MAG: hypothetical protein ACREM2_05035 [Vulcanimicrobiaceae bacterium]
MLVRRCAAFAGVLAALIAAGPFGARPARAAIETDPVALYQTMRRAYDEGAAKGWPFASELYYESTVFAAGRSYSLFRPSDPEYAALAELTVQVATQLHYDPLTNNDATLWYVREAASWVVLHDPALAAAGQALLTSLDGVEARPAQLAAMAVADAHANLAAFPGDPDAQAALLVADVRAYDLTRDPQYESDLLADAAAPNVPLERVPDPEFGQLFALVKGLLQAADPSPADLANARAIAYRRAHEPGLQTIARVTVRPPELVLTRKAPADEYFGDLKYSPLGVGNEIKRINAYLDVGWGTRMTDDALQVDSAIVDWQREYPRDETLPSEMLLTYKLLVRVDSPKTLAAATQLRSLLLVEYPATPQAQALEPS